LLLLLDGSSQIATDRGGATADLPPGLGLSALALAFDLCADRSDLFFCGQLAGRGGGVLMMVGGTVKGEGEEFFVGEVGGWCGSVGVVGVVVVGC